MIIYVNIFKEIKNTIGTYQPECGGILGSRNGIITDYYFDGHGDASCFTVDCDRLNKIIGRWGRQGIQFAGLIHSHPAGNRFLSLQDREYITQIMKANPHSDWCLYFPIVQPESETHSFEMFSYKACCQRNRLEISDDCIKIII